MWQGWIKQGAIMAVLCAMQSPAIAATQQTEKQAPAGMVWIQGGEFIMGGSSKESMPNERPAHRVQLASFWMDEYHVTNDQFAAFVSETNYITTAEKVPEWESIAAQLPLGAVKPKEGVLVPGGMAFKGTEAPVSLTDFYRWWHYVPGANWRQPQGPDSSITDKGDHPVVQISYQDALAYADWVGKRLPTEAEWEYAARGGLEQAEYAWGQVVDPEGKKMANIWDSEDRTFPVQAAKIRPGTEPVGSYFANDYGLYDMAGNAWQWVADWYRPDAFALQGQKDQAVINPLGPEASLDSSLERADAPRRVIRGGSFLCSEAYCMGYRVSARQGQDPDNSSSNVGFRLVKDKE